MKKQAIVLSLSLVMILAGQPATASPSFLVEPYLQNPSTDGMTVMWETLDDGSALEYWKDGDTPVGVNAQKVPGRNICFAALDGLESDTLYNYRVITDQGTDEIYRFKTWPADGDDAGEFKMIIFSDSQGNHPERLLDICENGIIDKECSGGEVQNCPEDIAAVLVAGDLVSSGDVVDQWREEFFGPCKELFHYVPLLPAIGNHDRPFVNYLDYFTLPDNGVIGRSEEWYTVDYKNLRIIALNSCAYTIWQWEWLDDVLADACSDPDIDYVLTQFHHACRSETWPDGNDIQACAFVHSLEEFTRDCGKVSGHFHGHTHAYSRGQSRDVPHVWMNVGTSAGNIDYWGEYDPQPDYDEFQVSLDEYGFTVWRIATEGESSLTMVRRSGGDDDVYYGYTDDTIGDELTIDRSNSAPYEPSPLHPVGVEVDHKNVSLQASLFSDPDLDFHLSSHWQVTEYAGIYGNPVVDAWGNVTRFENIYFDENTQEGVDITFHAVDLQPDKTYYWRVRYRDEHLVWSDWSVEASFTTAPLPAWGTASTMLVGANSFSDVLNSLMLIAIPLGTVMLWRRASRRRTS
ncbi:fibronectin type III domain-containing protein [Thermodesulfobacteriota bacterium]